MKLADSETGHKKDIFRGILACWRLNKFNASVENLV